MQRQGWLRGPLEGLDTECEAGRQTTCTILRKQGNIDLVLSCGLSADMVTIGHANALEFWLALMFASDFEDVTALCQILSRLAASI